MGFVAVLQMKYDVRYSQGGRLLAPAWIYKKNLKTAVNSFSKTCYYPVITSYSSLAWKWDKQACMLHSFLQYLLLCFPLTWLSHRQIFYPISTSLLDAWNRSCDKTFTFSLCHIVFVQKPINQPWLIVVKSRKGMTLKQSFFHAGGLKHLTLFNSRKYYVHSLLDGERFVFKKP